MECCCIYCSSSPLLGRIIWPPIRTSYDPDDFVDQQVPAITIGHHDDALSQIWINHHVRTKPMVPASMLEMQRIPLAMRSAENPSELASLMRNTYAVFCSKKKLQI